jgi:hypothetical protein
MNDGSSFTPTNAIFMVSWGAILDTYDPFKKARIL